MKRKISGIFFMLFFCGCAASTYQTTVYPMRFAQFPVSRNSADGSIPAGQYDVVYEEESLPGPSRPAVFEIYISDTDYSTMTPALQDDLIAAVSTGQQAKITLKNHQYLYICALDEDTLTYSDNLSGSLEIRGK